MTVRHHQRGDKTPLCEASYGQLRLSHTPKEDTDVLPPRVTEWTTIIQAPLPHLTKPQATVLALGSLGMVLARSWALTAIRAVLATWLGRTEPPVRQQW